MRVVKRVITGLWRFDHDEKSDHGYLVHLSRQGVLHRKRFADSLHGGKSGALKAARAWRNVIIDTYPHLSREQYAQILRKNNTSGTPGVFAMKNAAGEITGWMAHWLLPGSDRKVSRKFANSLHGAARAKQLAIAARENGVAGLNQEAWQGSREAPSAAANARRRQQYEAARSARKRDWRIARAREQRVCVIALRLWCDAAVAHRPMAGLAARQGRRAQGLEREGLCGDVAGADTVDRRAAVHARQAYARCVALEQTGSDAIRMAPGAILIATPVRTPFSSAAGENALTLTAALFTRPWHPTL